MTQEELNERVLDAVRRGDINDAQRALKQKELSEQLHIDVCANDIEAVKKALDEGADVNAEDENGYKPIHYASRDGNTELVKLLIEAGTDVNAKNKYGRTPLYFAPQNGRTETAELLKQHGGV